MKFEGRLKFLRSNSTFCNLQDIKFHYECFQDFVPINLEGVRVMLLRNSARYSSAVELINTIKAAVDAIDKGYLKELMLTVYLVLFFRRLGH